MRPRAGERLCAKLKGRVGEAWRPDGGIRISSRASVEALVKCYSVEDDDDYLNQLQ